MDGRASYGWAGASLPPCLPPLHPPSRPPPKQVIAPDEPEGGKTVLFDRMYEVRRGVRVWHGKWCIGCRLLLAGCAVGE